MPIFQKQSFGNLASVAANTKVTKNIRPVGKIYGIILKGTTAAGALVSAANIASSIDQFEMLFGGESIVRMKGDFMKKYNDYYRSNGAGGGAASGYLPFYAFPKGAVGDGVTAYGYGTLDLTSNVNIEISFGTLAGTLANVEVFLLMTDEQQNLGRHIRITRRPLNYNATGIDSIVLDSNNPNRGYKAIFVETASGVLSTMSLVLNAKRYYDSIAATQFDADNVNIGERVTQSQLKVMDFALLNSPNEYLDQAIKDIRLENNWSTATGTSSYDMYLEEIYNLSGK